MSNESRDSLRAVVVGGGSIGTRHLENLASIGICNRRVVEPNPRRRNTVEERTGARAIESIDIALEYNPDFVIIASPTHLHVQHALRFAREGIHFLVEKPLSHTDVGVRELIDIVSDLKLITLVGCNMRFHPGPAKVFELLNSGAIGRQYFARIHTGSYLPEWRPWQDYRASYSANASMGGGCLLDCIHEIDLTRWYLGSIDRVFCLARKQSDMDIDVEDVAALVCEHAGGVISEIHLDYVQRSYERGCQIVGKDGTICWDYEANAVRLYCASEGEWTTFSQGDSWEPNQMYIDELVHFVDCLMDGKTTMQSVADAANALEVVLAAKASSRTAQMIEIQYPNGRTL